MLYKVETFFNSIGFVQAPENFTFLVLVILFPHFLKKFSDMKKHFRDQEISVLSKIDGHEDQEFKLIHE